MQPSPRGYIRFSTAFMVLIVIAAVIVGGFAALFYANQQITALKEDISNLQSQISKIHGNQNVTIQNITLLQNSTALAQLYQRVRSSVVLVRGETSNGTVEGSGFIYDFNGTSLIMTNNHVVHGTSSLSVTFSDGNGYAAEVVGTDAYADLAVVSVLGASLSELKPLEVVSSSSLEVGDPVIAIGNPYGLVGSMTTGVISALGRTITEDLTGNYAIADIIQTSTPINPGNSGGPLLNYMGAVIGITAAIIENSQGVGFAIPSDTILREIYALVNYHTYTGHSYLGVSGQDMTYELARTPALLGVNVTYGWWITDVAKGGPADKAGLKQGDILIGINNTRIVSMDVMSSYLEENTLPGETVSVTVLRKEQILEKLQISIILGQRPPPP